MSGAAVRRRRACESSVSEGHPRCAAEGMQIMMRISERPIRGDLDGAGYSFAETGKQRARVRSAGRSRDILGGVLVLLFYPAVVGAADPTILDVQSNRFFVETGIMASPGESFLIRASGKVDLAALDGGYLTGADGAIAATPPADSGAFEFFRDRAGPFDTDPVEGSRKSFLPLADYLPGHLPGAPYGALVAGFSRTANPVTFDDFPNGFALIGNEGVARAPSTGGHLFLGVNDFNNPGGDNAGGFRVLIFKLHDLTEVDIDIKPGSDKNRLNPRSKGRVWVAILSEGNFDALQVDPGTVRLGPSGASPDRYRAKDINRDQQPDLALRFMTSGLGIGCEDTSLTLTGDTYAGARVFGSDEITTVSCR